jgi:hypothetical protein
LPVLVVTALVSCGDDEKRGVDQADDGVNFRMITESAQINLKDADPRVNLTMYSESHNIDHVTVLIERTQASTEETTERFVLKTFDAGSITNDGSMKLSLTLAQLAEAVHVNAGELDGGDSFTLYNIVTLNNGVTYPDTIKLTDETGTKKVLNLGNVFTSGGTTSYTPLITISLVCASDLGGTYSYVTTNIQCENCDASVPGEGACGVSVSGTGTLKETGNLGVYSVSDATFGEYGCAWADTPAEGVTLIDVCGKISTGGSDKYSLVYTFTIKGNDGETLTIDWENDYGDSGTTELTRTDGKAWPDNLQ